MGSIWRAESIAGGRETFMRERLTNTAINGARGSQPAD